MSKPKIAAEISARLLEIAAHSRNKAGLHQLNRKHDVELLCAQQKPEINPSYVPPPAIPEAFEQNDKPQFVWIMKTLGQGAQGVVYLADIDVKKITRAPTTNTNKQLHAIKVIQAHQEVEAGTKPGEVESLLSIRARHPNISQLEAFSSHSGHQMVYFTYSNAGDLMTLINGFTLNSGIIPESFIWDAYKQLLSAADFIQHLPKGRNTWNPIIHCDIKPENVFLTWKTIPFIHNIPLYN